MRMKAASGARRVGSAAFAIAWATVAAGACSDKPKRPPADVPADAAADADARAQPEPRDAVAEAAVEAATGSGGAPPTAAEAGVDASAPLLDAAPDAPPDATAAPPDAPSDAAPDAVPDVFSDARVSACEADGVRGLDEECDDGNDVETDFCTFDCRARDALLVGPTEPSTIPIPRRTIAEGVRPAAAGPLGGAVLYVDPAGNDLDRLEVGIVRPDGSQVGDGRGVQVDDEHPQGPPPFEDSAIVAIPGGRFAIAWTSKHIGQTQPGMDVALRTLDAASGNLGATSIANVERLGEQYLTDAVWTGSELVVAWSDRNSLPPAASSFLRRFDADLQPIGDEEPIAPDHTSVFGAFLTPFGGAFAHGWISNDVNIDRTVWVRAGDAEWSFGPYRLVADVQLVDIDDRHLFLVINERFENNLFPDYRMWGALLDVDHPEAAQLVPIDPLLTPAGSGEPAELEVSLTRAGDSLYLAWNARNGAPGTGLVLKAIPWGPGEGGVQLDLSLPEIPLPSTPERRPRNFEHPAITFAPWTPGGALFVASSDPSRTIDPDQRRPDVVVQSIPLPIFRFPEPVTHDQ